MQCGFPSQTAAIRRQIACSVPERKPDPRAPNKSGRSEVLILFQLLDFLNYQSVTMTTPENALDWSEIPAHLLISICESLNHDEGFLHSIADMRLVCKAWRAAIPTDGTSRSPPLPFFASPDAIPPPPSHRPFWRAEALGLGRCRDRRKCSCSEHL